MWKVQSSPQWVVGTYSFQGRNDLSFQLPNFTFQFPSLTPCLPTCQASTILQLFMHNKSNPIFDHYISTSPSMATIICSCYYTPTLDTKSQYLFTRKKKNYDTRTISYQFHLLLPLAFDASHTSHQAAMISMYPQVEGSIHLGHYPCLSLSFPSLYIEGRQPSNGVINSSKKPSSLCINPPNVPCVWRFHLIGYL